MLHIVNVTVTTVTAVLTKPRSSWEIFAVWTGVITHTGRCQVVDDQPTTSHHGRGLLGQLGRCGSVTWPRAWVIAVV